MAKLENEEGQMAVEFALVAPVLIVIGLILFSLTQYIYLSNKFEHVCRNVVVVEGVSPQGSETYAEQEARIHKMIADKFERSDIEVSVRSEMIDSSGQVANTNRAEIGYLRRYICTMSYSPIFSDLSIGAISAKGPLTLRSTCEIVVDPYRGGVVL